MLSTFRDFMAAALYGDDVLDGYYKSRVGMVGRQGDFSTSATLHPALGEAIAGWALEEMRYHRTGNLIECGPGDGALVLSLAGGLGRWARWRQKVHFHLVETSAGLEARQRERLAGLPVTWHPDIESALEACGGVAVIYSNEFVDAFPVDRFQWNADTRAWETLGVEHEHWNVIREMALPGPARTEPAASALARTDYPHAQRIEVGFDYADWLARMVTRLARGSLLTIDYGAPLGTLYDRQPLGSVRAYRGHQRLQGDEIYREPGMRDLTADVNFTDLRVWGEALGLATRTECSQADFLEKWVPRFGQRATEDERLSFLVDRAGAGEAFRVLFQRKKSAGGYNPR